MSGLEHARQEVMRALVAVVGRFRPILPGDRLIEDLGLDADASTRLIWDIENALGVDIPRDEYRAVLTVEALIELIDRHYDPLTAVPRHSWHM